MNDNVLNAWITWVWLSFHDKIWYPPLTPLSLCSWKKTRKQNETKQKLLEFQIWVCKTFGEKTASATSCKQDSHKGFTSRTFLSDVSLCL